MAKFDFNLDGVLRHRSSIEQQRQRELALVQRQMQQLQQELRELDQGAQDAAQQLRASHLTGPIDLNYLAAHRRFLASTQRKAIALVQKMAAVQSELESARRQLTDAATRRKVIEKLREKQFAAWRGELDRKMTAETDEIGMQLGYRNLREELQSEGEA